MSNKLKKQINYLKNFIKSNLKIVSPKEAFELKRRKEFLVENKLISYDYKKPAFINYARDFEYEAYAVSLTSEGDKQ